VGELVDALADNTFTRVLVLHQCGIEIWMCVSVSYLLIQLMCFEFDNDVIGVFWHLAGFFRHVIWRLQITTGLALQHACSSLERRPLYPSPWNWSQVCATCHTRMCKFTHLCATATCKCIIHACHLSWLASREPVMGETWHTYMCDATHMNESRPTFT